MDLITIVVDLRLLFAGRVAGLGSPRQEGAEASAAGVNEGSSALDQLLKVRYGLSGPGAGRGKELRGVDEPRQLRDQFVRFAVGTPRVQVAHGAEGSDDRLVTGGLPARTGRSVHPPPRTGTARRR